MKIDIGSIAPDPDLDRTLYLTEKKGLIVKRDGPSVWIQEDGSAGRRIPARFINMVVVIGNIMMDTGVVSLFSEKNVPIMFMNVRCEEVAVTAPSQTKLEGRLNLQKRILEKQGGEQAYGAWARSKRRKTAFLTRSYYAERKEGLFAMAWRDIAEMEQTINYAREQHRLVFNTAFHIIDELAREMIISMLGKTRLNPDAGILSRNVQFGFAKDISFMISPEIEVQAAAFAFSARQEHFSVNNERSCVLSRKGMKKIVETFEENKIVLGKYIEDILSSYLRFTKRVLL